jgi:hypothetical protein
VLLPQHGLTLLLGLAIGSQLRSSLLLKSTINAGVSTC